jgi:hypothetical protein
VTEADRLQRAVAELYSSDPDEFVDRRGALAAAARTAGQAPVAKQIAALRKPTRSAWVVNQLVRSEPAVISELTSLGAELRAAQGSLDGAAIRELSQRRRDLIESLSRRAFTVSGQPTPPPAGIRDDVTATLGAALADPQFAEQLAAGALVRAAQSEGFGPAPALPLVTSSGSRRPASPRKPPRPEKVADQARADALAEAEQAAAEAARDAATATEAEQDLENTVERLEEQLADARRSLADARAQARRARTRERYASQARDRLRG